MTARTPGLAVAFVIGVMIARTLHAQPSTAGRIPIDISELR
jgi:hypothetical protein